MIDPSIFTPRISPRIEPMEDGGVRLSLGWMLLAYVLGMLTVVGALWWGYQ